MAVSKVVRGDIAQGPRNTLILPDEVSETVLRGVAEQSIIRQYARERQMTANRVKITEAEVDGANVFWVGEGQRKRTDSPSMSTLTWTMDAAELAVIIPLDENVADDANLDLWDLYIPHIETAVARKLDAAALFGTDAPTDWGTSPSIVDQILLATSDFYEDATPTDVELLNLLAGTGATTADGALQYVEDAGFEPTAWLGNIRVKSRLRGLKDADNRYIFGDAIEAGVPSSLFGIPLSFTDAGIWDRTLAHVIVGDFSQAMVGVRQDIRYKIFDQGVITDGAGNVVYSLMESDMVALRVTARFGFKVFADDTADGQTVSGTSEYPFGLVGPEQV